ncbi:myb-like protein X isoform X7 [Cololabis saira]|uniref:myb-like protein X isoform X7 n=1 Tax=Cololabis saira TaxID=129043 RepID=UPI002AD3F093|nr:myb-like protein X isoform X7 [Cololabis saira]
MGRRRSSSPSTQRSDKEKEDRRRSVREKKKVIYAADEEDKMDCSNDSEEEKHHSLHTSGNRHKDKEDRRRSVREKKKVIYAADEEDEMDCSNDSEEEEHHSLHTSGNRFLPVTCGSEKGKLDVEKFERGEVCIECEGCWFSPGSFELLCGKQSNKNWKTSILHEDKPLKFWIEVACPQRGSRKYSKEKGRKCSCQVLRQRRPMKKTQKHRYQKKVMQMILKMAGDLQSAESCPGKQKRKKRMEIITHQTGCMTSPPKVKLLETLDEDANCEGETEKGSDEDKTMDFTEATPDKPSDSTIAKDDNEGNGEEFMESNERENGESRPGTETAVSESVSSSISPENQTEDKGPMSPSAGSSPNPVVTEEDSDLADNENEGAEVEMSDCKQENQAKRKERLDVLESEDTETSCATGKRLKTSSESTDQDLFEPLCLPISPVSVLEECPSEDDADVTISDLEATQLQVTMSDTRSPAPIVAPDCSRPSPARLSSSSEDDTMDMNQLKKEITCMQLKVLKLQEEYYTLKLTKMKKNQQGTDANLST